MNQVAISVKNLSKSYKLYNAQIDRLKEALHPLRKTYHHDFWALKDISFEVLKGETVGVIGKNGSGKSTLLKILSDVLTPTKGKYKVEGKVASLLELGAGFNPESTGRENIYFNAPLLGFSQADVEDKIEEIIKFADIGEFIDQPVKIYSSGMFMRLAFASAISVDPDILIIDEAFAVGDIRFQQKCFRKLEEFKKNKKTIIFVSQDTGTVINFCNKAIWLKDGSIEQIGKPSTVAPAYHAYMNYDAKIMKSPIQQIKINNMESQSNNYDWDSIEDTPSFGDGYAQIQGVLMLDSISNTKKYILFGDETVKILLKIKILSDILQPLIGFIIKDHLGNEVLGLNNHILEKKIPALLKNSTAIVSFIFDFPLIKANKYTITVAIGEGTQTNHVQHHWINDAYIFEVARQKSNTEFEWYFTPKNPILTVDINN